MNTIAIGQVNTPHFTLTQSQNVDVPTHLDPIYRTEGWILGAILFIGFLLLALGKRLEPTLFSSSAKSFFTIGTPESLQKLEVRFNSSGFFLVGLNFLLSLWVCFTLFIQNIGFSVADKWLIFGYELNSWQLTFATLISISCIILYNFLGFIVTAFLTDEKSVMRNFISQSWVNMLFFSYFFFALGIIWLLNPSGTSYFYQAFIYLILAFFGIRLLKTMIAAILEGISWYYIILYLCTLEILPLVVIYHYLVGF